MSTQPEALMLSDLLLNGEPYNVAPQAAAELRRLHSLNSEILQLLKEIKEETDGRNRSHIGSDRAHSIAKFAIAKAEGDA